MFDHFFRNVPLELASVWEMFSFHPWYAWNKQHSKKVMVIDPRNHGVLCHAATVSYNTAKLTPPPPSTPPCVFTISPQA